ncbi:hypothetical protein D3C72_1377580 [compost metagenome]
MQIVQRRIITQAKHHFGAVIGAVSSVKAVDAALKPAPTVVRRPGITLMVGLYRPTFAVEQAEPVAVLDLQSAFDIGAIAVFVLVLPV